MRVISDSDVHEKRNRLESKGDMLIVVAHLHKWRNATGQLGKP